MNDQISVELETLVYSFVLTIILFDKTKNYNWNSRITLIDSNGHGLVVCTGKTYSPAKLISKRFARELHLKVLNSLCKKIGARKKDHYCLIILSLNAHIN